MEKRVAFQILLTKNLYPSIRSSDIRTSRPWAVKAASVKRKASVPNLSIISSGSMLFPLDLLIFSPFSSRTSACR